MATEKEREKALDLALAQIEKQFGRGSIMKLGDAQSKMAVEVIPTGAIAIDIALGVGGLPRGRIVEVYGPESSGKCVTPDTLVFTERGMLPVGLLGDLGVEGFQPQAVRVYSEDGPAETSHFYNGGVKDTVRIQTACGFRLEGTPNHRVRALTRQGEYAWRRLDELAVGDRVAIQCGQGFFGPGADLSGSAPAGRHPSDRSGRVLPTATLGPDLGRLLGYLVGESTRAAPHLKEDELAPRADDDADDDADDGVADDLRRLWRRVFGETPRAARDPAARAFLARCGLGHCRAEQREVPWAVLCSPRPVVAEFLRGLFESAGSLSGLHVELVSRSERLARQVQIVLLNFGILSRLRREALGGEALFRVQVAGRRDLALFAAEIGFVGRRKRLRLAKRLFALGRCGRVGRPVALFRQGPALAVGEFVGFDLPGVARGFARSSGEVPPPARAGRLAERRLCWDVVAVVEPSRAHVVDLTVPGPAAFFGNGFINHNTTVALHVVAEAQKRGGTAAFIDAEHALDPVYARKLGVDVDNLLVSQPDTGEQALEIAEALVRSGAVDVIVVDSVAALVPRAEIEGEMGDSHVGLQARLMSQALRKLTGAISKSRTCAIFINQLREKVGVMFGNPEVTPGGRALKFYASVRLEVRRIETLKQGSDMVGIRARVKVVKNKVAPPFKQAEVDIMYDEGISAEGSLLDVAAEQNIIQKSGAWFSYNDQRIGQGRENARDYLKQHPEVAREIEARIRDALKMGAVQARAASAAEEAE